MTPQELTDAVAVAQATVTSLTDQRTSAQAAWALQDARLAQSIDEANVTLTNAQAALTAAQNSGN